MIPPLLTIGLTTLALLAEWGGLVIASLLAETCPGLENTSDITVRDVLDQVLETSIIDKFSVSYATPP